MQVSSNSLSLEARKRVLSTERPRVEEKVDLDDAFEAFLREV